MVSRRFFLALVLVALPLGAAAQDSLFGRYQIIDSARIGDFLAVRSLVNGGVNINMIYPDTKTTALNEAAKFGHTRIVALLIDRNVKIDHEDKFGSTPLQWAASHGHVDVVRLLVEAGADVEATDGQGFTPLIKAARGGHRPIVETLIAAGADVNRADYTGLTPLMVAERERHDEIVEILRAAGGY